jgi:hypothetical protein
MAADGCTALDEANSCRGCDKDEEEKEKKEGQTDPTDERVDLDAAVEERMRGEENDGQTTATFPSAWE